ncbi:MAG TPA: hypothetical protein VJX92_04235 [Methylomirabilota bacterium]|nr:hypothetical protein [Methylomirabilota bacterium]
MACANGLSVRVGTVETRLVATLRERVLQPAAITYLMAAVNRQLEVTRTGQAGEAVEAELAHVETELRNIEDAIVQDVVGKTTAALLQDRERRREALRRCLHALADGLAIMRRHVGPAEIRAALDRLPRALAAGFGARQQRLPTDSGAGHGDTGGEER